MKRCLLLAVVLVSAMILGLGSVTPFEDSGRAAPEELQAKAKAVLAQLEGEIAVPGLKEPVEVLRDRWGVPHIYAKNQDDLFFAQGFVAAQDRLFQLDMWRRVALGETAEVVGKPGVEGDRFARLIQYRGDMQAEWASYSPDTQRIAAAFTNGINAYIDHLGDLPGDRLPIEFQILGIKPEKWKPEDILGRMSGIIMTRNFQTEVSRAELIAAVGVEKARRLAPTDPPRAYAPASGLDLAGLDRSILAGFRDATRPLPFVVPPAGGEPEDRLKAGLRTDTSEGSNDWVIDGTLSASGKPMLANDPHRNIALPALRYLVHLNAPGWNVIGSGEPALPGVAIGHNDRIAWGFTIVGTDQADLYVEETNPADDTQYQVGDRWEKMKIIREQVAVRGEKEPVEVELRYTRHGPVLHQDAKRHRAYALRWVGNEPGGAGYLGSLAIDRAGNWKEFLATCQAWKLPGENIVYADVEGNIGWIAAAQTPIRTGWDGLLPVPGASGTYEWQGFRKIEELPQVFNPANHYVATANHNILPPGYKHEIAYDWAARYRFERIRQRMEAKRKFDLEEFKSIQHENTSLPGQALARLVKTVDMRDPTLKPFVELLAGWDGVLSREAKAGPLYALWLQELQTAFYRPHVPENLLTYVRGGRGTEVMLAALEKPDQAWFGENPAAGRDQLLRQTFAAAVQKTKTTLADDPSQWAWGKLHTATLRHALAGLGTEYEKAFNLEPVARPGDAFTPNAATHNERFQQISGASYRHLFDLADWDRGLATSAPGQSGQPGSPHYGDLLPLWAEGEYFPLAFSRAKVEELTRHRLLLKPAGK